MAAHSVAHSPQLLGAGQRRHYPLVLHQGRGKPAEHRVALDGTPTQLPELHSVPHLVSWFGI